MKMTIENSGILHGDIAIHQSKSEAHRALICASLASGRSRIVCPLINDDIKKTADCLVALGAKISYENGVFTVDPIENVKQDAILDCGESGSTLRFLLPIAAALGAKCSFVGHGRLPSRPLSPLYELLVNNGVTLSENGKMPLYVSGCLEGEIFSIDGGVSSQFVSGLLFTLPKNNALLCVFGNVESKPYITMTAHVMEQFGIRMFASDDGRSYHTCGDYKGRDINVGGDWSSAAFWLAAGAMGADISVSGLSYPSCQGDSRVLECLEKFGARIVWENGTVKAVGKELTATKIDATDIPDLVPALAAVASVAKGVTVFENISRLRLKESDRVEAVIKMLESFKVNSFTDGYDLWVEGGQVQSGCYDSFADHRIAMAGALLACVAQGQSSVNDGSCVSKSYPLFWEHLEKLGARVWRS